MSKRGDREKLQRNNMKKIYKIVAFEPFWQNLIR